MLRSVRFTSLALLAITALPAAGWAAGAAAHVEATLGATLAIARAPSGRRSLRAAIVSRHTSDSDVDAVAAALGEHARR